MKAKKEQIENIEEKEASETILSPDEAAYKKGYERGFLEGHYVAANKFFEYHASETAPQKIDEKEEAPSSQNLPLTLSSPPSHLICSRCGHTKEMHEPLNANACFDRDCKCRGYSNKKHFKIGAVELW